MMERFFAEKIRDTGEWGVYERPVGGGRILRHTFSTKAEAETRASVRNGHLRRRLEMAEWPDEEDDEDDEER